MIVVQLGAATSYDGRDWAVGTVRETQRRFARGDVLILRGVPADARVRIELTVQVGETKGDQIRWADSALAGVQIRPAAK